MMLKATEKSVSVLNWNYEVVDALFRVGNTWASFPGHYREGISCDRKFLEDICRRWSTLVLQVQHVNLLEPYAETLRAPPAVFSALSLFWVSKNKESTERLRALGCFSHPQRLSAQTPLLRKKEYQWSLLKEKSSWVSKLCANNFLLTVWF